MNVGKSYRLKLNNNESPVIWKSSSYQKVTVSTSGRIVARKKGTVKITAKVGRKTYTCKVTVKQPVTKVKLNKTKLTMNVGNSVGLKATVSPSNANNRKLTWTSSNKKVATVTSSGKVKAVAAGTAVITAKAKDGSGKKATCKITVVKKTETVSGGTVPPSPGGETDITNGAPSANAKKLLAALKTMSARIKSDRAQGRQWVYKTVRHDRTWEAELADAASGGEGNCTCIQMVRWGLKLAGIITVKQDTCCATNGVVNGVFTYNKALGAEAFHQKFEVIRVNKTNRQLIKEGILRPGDICGYVGHENVYAGNGKWYDAGRGADGGYKNGKYMFNSFGPVSGWMDQKVVEILRLK